MDTTVSLPNVVEGNSITRWITRPQAAIKWGDPVGGVDLVHLREEKVSAQLGEKKDRDVGAWICDTGATNHMSGSRDAFSELDKTFRGTVRFRDDSVAEIEGRGVVVFRCKNGE
jgi:hypothetical protein